MINEMKKPNNKQDEIGMQVEAIDMMLYRVNLALSEARVLGCSNILLQEIVDEIMRLKERRESLIQEKQKSESGN